MHLKQIILLVLEFVILDPDITAGLEIIPTTTETGVNKDERCEQEVITTLVNNLREQQNFWISCYNSSHESQCQKKIMQLFDKKLEETNAQFEKKQKEVEKELKGVTVEMGGKQKELIEGVNDKLNDLLQHFDKKIEEMEAKFASKQETVLKQFKEEIEKITLPKNCLEVFKRGNTVSGVYTIQPNIGSTSFKVLCDMDTRGGGWTYVLNRFDGSQDFYLDWQNYKNGFGNLSGEFWLGLEHLYELTGSESNRLLVELVDYDDKHYHAIYNMFGIGNEEEGYPLKVLDGYSGDAGDSLGYHKNMKFSTHDRDEDKSPGKCAVDFHGAWWYQHCHHSNLAGTYFNTAKNDAKGMVWYAVTASNISLKKVKMMVKP